ncbi:hypothetical protein F4604DRAFT_1694331 [Suillus subluteus]|nr:hypothetical protein F4604DRAFT_1694331 [Suillus subluteus]
MSLPTRSPTIVTVKVKHWFSHDLPDSDISYLKNWPIPAAGFLTELNKAFSQAWLDGARSLADPQFAFLPSTAFLCLLTAAPKVTPSGLELAPADISMFEILLHAPPQLIQAAKLFCKRVNQAEMDRVIEGDEDA